MRAPAPCARCDAHAIARAAVQAECGRQLAQKGSGWRERGKRAAGGEGAGRGAPPHRRAFGAGSARPQPRASGTARAVRWRWGEALAHKERSARGRMFLGGPSAGGRRRLGGWSAGAGRASGGGAGRTASPATNGWNITDRETQNAALGKPFLVRGRSRFFW